MAYDLFLADRIRQQLQEKNAPLGELNMMGWFMF